MSSEVQSVLNLRQNNYVSLAMFVAVGYDYILTFRNEIELIWSKPWTRVSTLFVIVRYAGLYSLAISSLFGTSFEPGAKVVFACKITYIIHIWMFFLFLGAADLVMVLRVWAMYNRSRLVLRALLFLFSMEVISFILTAVVDNDPRKMQVVTIQIHDVSVCMAGSTMGICTRITAILQMTHSAAMCVLAIVQFVRESFQMYRVTKRWRPNRYMSLLVKQGIFYFLAVFMCTLITLISIEGKFPSSGWQMILLFILEYVPMFTLTPRFVLSIRALYARDVRERYGREIDTGFGLSAFSCRDVGGATVVDADDGQEEVGWDEVEVELRTMGPE